MSCSRSPSDGVAAVEMDPGPPVLRRRPSGIPLLSDFTANPGFPSLFPACTHTSPNPHTLSYTQSFVHMLHCHTNTLIVNTHVPSHVLLRSRTPSDTHRMSGAPAHGLPVWVVVGGPTHLLRFLELNQNDPCSTGDLQSTASLRFRPGLHLPGSSLWRPWLQFS